MAECKMLAGTASSERQNEVAGTAYRNICPIYGLNISMNGINNSMNIACLLFHYFAIFWKFIAANLNYIFFLLHKLLDFKI